jgi:hypothetical protein
VAYHHIGIRYWISTTSLVWIGKHTTAHRLGFFLGRCSATVHQSRDVSPWPGQILG